MVSKLWQLLMFRSDWLPKMWPSHITHIMKVRVTYGLPQETQNKQNLWKPLLRIKKVLKNMFFHLSGTCRGKYTFLKKSICIILRWVTVISQMIQITTYLCTCSFKHFIFAPTTRGLKCFTQFQCKTVQFGELMSWLPFRKSHTACPQCCTTHWKKSFSGALKYCFTRSH